MKNCIIFMAGFIILSACAKGPVYETEIVKIKPPLPLSDPLPIPSFTGQTNEDLLLYTLTLEQNLNLCNARLSAIKKSVE